MCWTILQCLFLLQSEAHGSLQKPAFLSAIEDHGLRAPKPTASVTWQPPGWYLCPIVPFETLASSLAAVLHPALYLTLDPTSLYPLRGCTWTIPTAWVCTATSKLHVSIQSWVWVVGRILKPGYTQLLVTQSSGNLGAAVQGFCRFNYVARSGDLEKGRLSWVSLA